MEIILIGSYKGTIYTDSSNPSHLVLRTSPRLLSHLTLGFWILEQLLPFSLAFWPNLRLNCHFVSVLKLKNQICRWWLVTLIKAVEIKSEACKRSTADEFLA